MLQEAIFHLPKSAMAYALDKSTLSITLQTARNDVEKVELIIGDPFEWHKDNERFRWSGDKEPKDLMEKKSFTELFDYFSIDVPSPTSRSKYAFLIHSKGEVFFYGCRNIKKVDLMKDGEFIYDLSEYFNFPYINQEDLIDSPEWASKMVWYQIFPDRFNRSRAKLENMNDPIEETSVLKHSTVFGGDLQGVIEKIPYLKDLGITGVYFTPLFKSPSVHKYDTVDYFQIDPSFGTNEDFKELVERFHEAGIKVMLDAVFNHCGFSHPFFQDVVKNKKESKYWNCFFIENEDFIDFEIDETGRPKGRVHKPKFRTFAFTPHMPKLNTADPVMEKYLLDVAKFWVEKYDIDGWRLDVSNEVSHAFWRKFKAAVRSIKDDVYILGENWDNSMPWLMGDQMDGVMNYSLSFPVWEYFGKSPNRAKLSGLKFVSQINKLFIDYPKTVSKFMFNMLDSHDTMRLLSKVGENKRLLKICFLFIFILPGSPVIYYGDEIGLPGKDTEEARRPMVWNENFQDHELLEYFKKLISLRFSIGDFSSSDLKFEYFDDESLVIKKNKLLIFLNSSNKEKILNIPNDFMGESLQDLFENKSIIVGEKQQVPPQDYIVYQKNKNR